MFTTKFSNSLRQGDILDKVFFTAPNFYIMKDSRISIPNLNLKECYLVLLSQCCDLQWDKDDEGHSKPRNGYVLVAPLSLKIPFKNGTIEYKYLVQNGKNRPDKDPIQYFYYENNEKIGIESVVDFSSIMPIRSSTLKELEGQKLLELDILNRHLLRTRLREYFSRIPNEDWEETKKLFPEDFG
jgi:hypothetical protein